MGASGSKSVTVTSWDTLIFSWKENGQNISSRQTTVDWRMELISTNDGRIDSVTAKEWSVTVDGHNYGGTVIVGIGNNETKTLASGTTIITHDLNGEKSFSYAFSQDFTGITFSGVALGKVSSSGSGTLTPINSGFIYIDNGTSFDAYQVYIDNGTSWDLYIPYVDNGSSWDMLG